MAKDIRVNPTPIQRNLNDVAMELTQLYYREHPINDIEEVQETYAKFYAIAAKMYYPNHKVFDKLIPEEIINKL